MESRKQQIDQLAEQIIADGVCAELAGQATQLVIGDGDPGSQIVFVGEAPGKQEDLQGKPFVGASGKFLDEMLASIGLERSQVYITNIVKYRPPGNRDPLPEEKRAFWPYLMRQLAIINPRVIIALGRHAMNCFIPEGKISQDHGHLRQVRSHRDGQTYLWQVLPLYHPAAALYNGAMRQTLLDDFRKIKPLLDSNSK